MPKRTIEHADVVMSEALADYARKELTTTDIATKYGISAATLTVWAKRAGMKLRKRGRRPQAQPNARQLQIVKMAGVYKYKLVGKRFGMHKQSVHRIVKRWGSYAEPNKPPFSPGDMLCWRGKKLTVISATVHEGTLIDENGKYYRNFSWSGGHIPKKVGVNPRYVVKAARSAA